MAITVWNSLLGRVDKHHHWLSIATTLSHTNMWIDSDMKSSIKLDYLGTLRCAAFTSSIIFRLLLHAPQARTQADNTTEGDPTDGHASEATCVDWWCAANADSLKGMHNTFAEMGVFISACQHGIIWTIIDMMWSGELWVLSFRHSLIYSTDHIIF